MFFSGANGSGFPGIHFPAFRYTVPKDGAAAIGAKEGWSFVFGEKIENREGRREKTK